ncbi:unnamed protein product [marine sediment metagenome]|uniref:Uncharacterized protein n=1 Tax=marine sediment metagenome TaxID=412755 RepID=X1JMD9_9ZZZZ
MNRFFPEVFLHKIVNEAAKIFTIDFGQRFAVEKLDELVDVPFLHTKRGLGYPHADAFQILLKEFLAFFIQLPILI